MTQANAVGAERLRRFTAVIWISIFASVTGCSSSDSSRPLETKVNENAPHVYAFPRCALVRLGKPLNPYEYHRRMDGPIAISSDGRWVAYGGHSLFLCDVADLKSREIRKAPGGEIHGVEFSRDGRLLFYIDEFGEGRALETAAWREVSHFTPDDSSLRGLAPLPGNEIAATGRNDGCIQVWKLSREAPLMTLQGRGAPTHCLAVSPDGERLVSGSWGGIIQLWSVRKGIETARFQLDQRATDVSIARDLKRALSVASLGDVRCWNLTTGLEEWHLEVQSASCAAVSTGGGIAAIGTEDSKIIVWDLSRRRERVRFEGLDSPARTLLFSADDRLLVSGLGDNSAVVWDLEKALKDR